MNLFNLFPIISSLHRQNEKFRQIYLLDLETYFILFVSKVIKNR